MSVSMRTEIINYISGNFKAEPEYLWAKFPDYAVFRHGDNKKWFAILMDIQYEKLDRDKSGMIDVLNVKLGDPLLRDLLIQQDGYYAGYHISRGNWISVVLDGTVPLSDICRFIDMSFSVTASSSKKNEIRPPKEWLIPSNPKYYDIISAFNENDIIDWKQGQGIKKNDTVFLYVGAPVSAVLYKCKVIETDIPYEFNNGSLSIRKLMKIKLQKRYPPECFTFERLRSEFGIFAVRGPRGIPNSLSAALR